MNGQRETYHSCEIKFLNNEYKTRFFCKAIIEKEKERAKTSK